MPVVRKLLLQDLDLRGRRVQVRVDFNVPLQDDGAGNRSVADGTRVRAAIPTIRTITGAGGKAILISHLGRPKGRPVPALSLRPVAAFLEKELGKPVAFVAATVGSEAAAAVRRLTPGGILLLENTRFFSGETNNDPAFAASLAALGDLFVNDAFGTAHRAHASNVGLASCTKQSAAGLLLQRELEVLERITESPDHPVVALVGGAKVSDKIGVLTSLVSRVDLLLIGGAMAFTFLKAQHKSIGRSLVEDDRMPDAMKIYRQAGNRLRLPVDFVTSHAISDVANAAINVESVPQDRMGLDIGPNSIAEFREQILEARTVIWNGPMGVFEVPAFSGGTHAMAQALADATRQGAVTVVGGGDSVAALAQSGLTGAVTHVCTGGGAMLDFLEGKTLPGVAALTDRT